MYYICIHWKAHQTMLQVLLSLIIHVMKSLKRRKQSIISTQIFPISVALPSFPKFQISLWFQSSIEKMLLYLRGQLRSGGEIKQWASFPIPLLLGPHVLWSETRVPLPEILGNDSRCSNEIAKELVWGRREATNRDFPHPPWPVQDLLLLPRTRSRELLWEFFLSASGMQVQVSCLS